jgi:hypothetical protein
MATESFLVGMAGFVLFALLFVALLRLRLPIGWFALIIITGLGVHLLSIAAGTIWVKSFSYWYSTSVFAFLWFCFFFVCSIYSVSVSLGIINYLYEQAEKTAPLSKIYEQCIVASFRERADFLITTGQAQKVERGYIATPAGLQTVQRIRLIQKVLGLKSYGFYSTTSAGIDANSTGDNHP